MSTRFRRKDYLSLVFFFLMIGITAFLAGKFTTVGLGAWYESLNQPFFQPPSYLFGPVWTFLYILIALSGWIAYRRLRDLEHQVMNIFFLQLVLNAGWSAFFFTLQMPFLALIEIIILLWSITAYIYYTWRHSRTAAALFVPYWLWVLYATLLNVGIVILN